jgi:hypothetical protein
MRTKAFLRPATSCAVALAAIVAAAAIGAPGPAFAGSCGVSSGTPSTGISGPPSSNAGVHVGAPSTHGTNPSSCATTHNTVTASVGTGSIRGTALIGGTSGGHREHEHQHTITATNNKWVQTNNKWVHKH